MDEVKANIANLFKTLLMGILICGVLTACGFNPRSPTDNIPQQMRVLYLDSSNPYHPLVVQLHRTLQALNVQFTQFRKNSPVILRINDINWNAIIPPIMSTTNTITYTYVLHVTVALETKEGKRIRGPHTFSLSRTLVQNNTQLYTPNATRLMKREMTRTMVDLIYHYLTTTPNR